MCHEIPEVFASEVALQTFFDKENNERPLLSERDKNVVLGTENVQRHVRKSSSVNSGRDSRTKRSSGALNLFSVCLHRDSFAMPLSFKTFA